MLDFHINSKGIGDELFLKKPGMAPLEVRVHFDLFQPNCRGNLLRAIWHSVPERQLEAE